jgi:hypothetical protein
VKQDNGALSLSLNALQNLIQFLIMNTYVMNGEVLKRQVVGIPMGTNCAPNLANLYLYAYESEFIDRLVSIGKINVAKSFHMTFRLIDDTLSIDNPHWRVYIAKEYSAIPVNGDVGGIYPKALILNDTTVKRDKEVTFLGIRICDFKGKLKLSVFDKRSEFPFNVIRYPNMHSIIPTNIPYGVLTGQLYRYHRICSSITEFVKEGRKIVTILLAQGCTINRITQTIEKFLHFLNPNTTHWRHINKIKNHMIVSRIMRNL